MRDTMTVRGGKNRVLVFTGAGLLIVALLLFYHNAATRLDEARLRYEKCHLNEESLSAQNQVILEYKNRLEKSLQQEKTEHSQTKDEMKKRGEEERQTREKENLENLNKFTALQQQYKLLQSQHEDVTQELEKAKQHSMTSDDERVRLEGQIASLTQQAKLVQEGRQTDAIMFKSKIAKLEADYSALQKDGDTAHLIKEKEDLQRELTECLRRSTSTTAAKKSKEEGAGRAAEDTLRAPAFQKAPIKTSSPSSLLELNDPMMAVHQKSSTPLINPEALLSQPGAPPPAAHLPIPVIPAVPEFKDQHVLQEGQELNRARPQPQIPLPGPGAGAGPHDYDEYKEKEEDDDDLDPNHYPENKDPEPAQAPPNQPLLMIPRENHDSVQINPK